MYLDPDFEHVVSPGPFLDSILRFNLLSSLSSMAWCVAPPLVSWGQTAEHAAQFVRPDLLARQVGTCLPLDPYEDRGRNMPPTVSDPSS